MYLKLEFNRTLDDASEIWDFWASKLGKWPHLSHVVLLLLAAPIGNSALERSFRMVKKGSLDPIRQRASPESKSIMNIAHVNGDLKLSSLAPRTTSDDHEEKEDLEEKA